MSEKKNDGGSVFPLPPYSPEFQGMTLRDYFASQAMIGVMQAHMTIAAITKTQISDEIIAELSFKIASAMLRERDK